MFNFDTSGAWDEFDRCGVTHELVLLRSNANGVLTFYKFDVPYGWFRRKLSKEYGDVSPSYFRRMDDYFDEVEKIYAEAEKLGIAKDFRKV